MTEREIAQCATSPSPSTSVSRVSREQSWFSRSTMSGRSRAPRRAAAQGRESWPAVGSCSDARVAPPLAYPATANRRPPWHSDDLGPVPDLFRLPATAVTFTLEFGALPPFPVRSGFGHPPAEKVTVLRGTCRPPLTRLAPKRRVIGSFWPPIRRAA